MRRNPKCTASARIGEVVLYLNRLVPGLKVQSSDIGSINTDWCSNRKSARNVRTHVQCASRDPVELGIGQLQGRRPGLDAHQIDRAPCAQGLQPNFTATTRINRGGGVNIH